jgi:cytosine/adenosine deaminase-related metal-dependent hydrolase
MEIFAASYLLPVSAPPIEGGAIVVESGRIVAVGPLAELRNSYRAPCREFPGSTIIPGLVNAHTHLELTHFPSWKLRKGIDYSPRTYVDWVIQVIKIRRALTRPELEHSVREGLRVSLESGTTAVGEILTDRSLLYLYADTSLSGRLYFEAIGQDPTRCESLLADIDESLTTFPAGHFRPGVSPHAPHTLSPRFMHEVSALAARHGVPTAIHIAESREEMAFLHDSSGRIAELLYPFAGWDDHIPPPRRTTPVAYLDSLGALPPRTAVIHCVHVTPADAELLGKRGVTAVLCPRSNDRLYVGKAPALLLKKSGIPLALGTDSLASNDSLSLWDEMRFLRKEFPAVFTPGEVLDMATVNGARALGLDSEVGSLEEGKRADFLVMNTPRTGAGHELTEALIEVGQVGEVFIGGVPLGL